MNDTFLFKIPQFNSTRDYVYELWSLHIKASRRGKKIANALADKSVYMEVTDEILFIVVMTVSDSSLRALQSYKTAKLHRCWNSMRKTPDEEHQKSDNQQAWNVKWLP